MPQKLNKYGLSRSIPSDVKRTVRQKCGFGCVKCGSAIYQYEHVIPEFKDAKKHDPENIVLLCGSCHDLVTRGILSKISLQEIAKHPKCNEMGFSFGPFDLGGTNPEIIFGSYKCTNVEVLLSVYGESIFSVRPPEVKGAPFLVNALMTDSEGNETLRIENNEWRSNSLNWDVEVVGKKIIIRKKQSDFALVLRTEPPEKLIVEKLKMEYKGVSISCEEEKNIFITNPSGGILFTNGMTVKNYKIGLNITENGFELPSGGGTGSFVSMDYFGLR